MNGYLAASTGEILDPNVVYTYDYTLVVGALDDIRAYAVEHRPDPRPVYRFSMDRASWWEQNASDAGAPIRGALRVHPDREDPQLYGPETAFRASGVRALYIRGAWHTRQVRAQLFWSSDAGFSGDRVGTFLVENDGRFHTYRVRLAGLSGWTGMVRGLRLDPVDSAEPGRWVDIACISWKPCPRARGGERALVRSRPTVVFRDSFDSSLNPAFWFDGPGSPGTTTETSGGRLVVTLGEGAQETPKAGFIGAGIASRCRLAGDYDMRVDYRLLEWPSANGVHLNFGSDDGGRSGDSTPPPATPTSPTSRRRTGPRRRRAISPAPCGSSARAERSPATTRTPGCGSGSGNPT